MLVQPRRGMNLAIGVVSMITLACLFIIDTNVPFREIDHEFGKITDHHSSGIDSIQSVPCYQLPVAFHKLKHCLTIEEKHTGHPLFNRDRKDPFPRVG